MIHGSCFYFMKEREMNEKLKKNKKTLPFFDLSEKVKIHERQGAQFECKE